MPIAAIATESSMTIQEFLALLSLLGTLLGAVLLLFHAVSSRKRPDPQGSLWRHLFR